LNVTDLKVRFTPLLSKKKWDIDDDVEYLSRRKSEAVHANIQAETKKRKRKQTD